MRAQLYWLDGILYGMKFPWNLPSAPSAHPSHAIEYFFLRKKSIEELRFGFEPLRSDFLT